MKAVKAVLILILLTGTALADPQPQAKLTKSLICHSVDSPWWDKIKSPVATFKTVKDCLNSIEGAREPKRKKKKTKGGK